MVHNTLSPIRRRALTALIAIGAVVGGVIVAPLSAQAAASVSIPDAVAQILADTNALRTAGGLAPLVESTAMDSVAQNWSAQMYANGSLTHNPSYSTQIPAGWTGAAENIASGYTATTVVEAWHQSTGHYANIMGSYNAIGIGYYELGGQTYFTQDFGNYTTVPSPAPVSAPTPAPTSSPSASASPSASPSAPASPQPPAVSDTTANQIQAVYLASGGASGPFGNATSGLLTFSGGTGQTFANGSIYTSPAGTFTLLGRFNSIYTALRGPAGTLGWPLSTATTCTSSNICSQQFQNGTLYLTTRYSWISSATIETAYENAGGPAGTFGIPVTNITTFSGGTGQTFANGSIYTSPAGTFTLLGRFNSIYTALRGPAGTLGWPLSTATTCTSSNICSQQFQNGTLYLTTRYSWISSATIETAYENAGGPAGTFGIPVTNITTFSGGTGQTFANGSIYTSPAGTFTLLGRFNSIYTALRGPAGTLGWPLSTATTCTSSNICSQQFQNGTLYLTTRYSWISSATIETAYENAGGPAGTFGIPVTNITTFSGGTGQTFANGSIYTSPAGTFTLLGRFNSIYTALRGPAGTLGWPLSTATTCTSSNICSQQFQNGTLYLTTRYSWISSATIETAYENAGGPAGTFGIPVTNITTFSGGTGQTFANGSIYTSPAGTFTLLGRFNSIYTALRGPAGTLGWPLSTATTCTSSNICSQQFQNGTLYLTTRYSWISSATIETAYENAGGPTGTLGIPLTNITCTSSNTCSQQYQYGALTAAAGSAKACISSGDLSTSAAGCSPAPASTTSSASLTGSFPTRDSAGLPAGWAPTQVVTGDIHVTTPGAVISDLRITDGTIYVEAPNVTLNRIQGIGAFVNNAPGSTCNANLLVENSTFIPNGPTADQDDPVIQFGSYTAKNIVIDGAPEGLRVSDGGANCGPVNVIDSFIRVKSPTVCGDWHGDGIQGYGGGKVTVRNTTILMQVVNGCQGTAPFFYPKNQGNTSVDIDGLLLGGDSGYPFRDGMPGTVKNLNVIAGSWGYGPVDVNCSALTSFQGQVVTLNAAGQPVSTNKSIACTGSGI